MAKKKTCEEYVRELAEINPNIELIGKYINTQIKIIHRCKIDGYEWEVAPKDVVRGYGCPKCAGNIKKTHEEYVVDVRNLNPNIEVIGKYNGNKVKIAHKCNVCGYEWLTKPNVILSGRGCPSCANNLKKTHKEYVAELELVNQNIEVLGEYVNTNTKILHKCKTCNHEWLVTPHHLLHDRGCPICSGRVVGSAPEYRNSAWSSKYRKYLSAYLTEEQMKMYTPKSDIKVSAKCPDCGRCKQIALNTLIRQGLGCTCGDGNSYPNKFMYSVLNQLDVAYEIEYSQEWSNGKRYDIYIPSLNCIIENHGRQHYEESSGVFDSLKETQDNDKYKIDLAVNNGIKYYVVIDCRESEIEWIKHHIMNSVLPELLHFNENDINWEECDKFAMSNLVVKSAELWNKGFGTGQICDSLMLTYTTVVKYLKKANKFKWCNYSKEESRKRTAKNNSGANNHCSKRVIRLSDKMIYCSVKQCAKENAIDRHIMTKNCRLHKDFMYYDEWLTMQEENKEAV